MLYGGGGDDAKNQNNQFKTSVIDTIVAEVQNVPGDDRCVLLLGYEQQMIEMFNVSTQDGSPLGEPRCLLQPRRT